MLPLVIVSGSPRVPQLGQIMTLLLLDVPLLNPFTIGFKTKK